jgi:hypothetical protein
LCSSVGGYRSFRETVAIPTIGRLFRRYKLLPTMITIHTRSADCFVSILCKSSAVQRQKLWNHCSSLRDATLQPWPHGVLHGPLVCCSAAVLLAGYASNYISVLSAGCPLLLPFTSFRDMLDHGSYRLGAMQRSAQLDFFDVRTCGVDFSNRIYVTQWIVLEVGRVSAQFETLSNPLTYLSERRESFCVQKREGVCIVRLNN